MICESHFAVELRLLRVVDRCISYFSHRQYFANYQVQITLSDNTPFSFFQVTAHTAYWLQDE